MMSSDPFRRVLPAVGASALPEAHIVRAQVAPDKVAGEIGLATRNVGAVPIVPENMARIQPPSCQASQVSGEEHRILALRPMPLSQKTTERADPRIR